MRIMKKLKPEPFREPELEEKYQKVLRKGIFDKLKKIKIPSS